MTQLKPRVVESGLTNKGFRPSEGDHLRFVYYHGERKTEIRTMVSHSSREIGDELIHRMARQIRLSKAEFISLVSCTLSQAEYADKLRTAGVNLDPAA